MENAEFDSQQLTKELLMQWLEQKQLLSDRYKSTLYQLGCSCFDNVSILYNINRAIVNGQEYISEGEEKVVFKVEGNTNTLIVQDDKMQFSKSQLKEMITGMIDILETILPLGTVVDIKKQFLLDRIPVNEIENIRIVITNRFLYQERDKTYFTYAGVVYPVGMFERNEIIHFTSALIESIVHAGYSDIQEEAYVYLMKRELILESGMHSYGFSTEEERDKLQSRMKSEVQ